MESDKDRVHVAEPVLAIEKHRGDLLARLLTSERSKSSAFGERRRFDEARRASRVATAAHQKALQSLKSAQTRDAELRSGRGTLMFKAVGVTVYEFWLELPGFSGPVRGATAQLDQHGDVHQVSDVSSKTKSGLGGAVVGGLLLGPIGAVAGLAATRKNNVKTTVKTVDTRQFELQVRGPGFAWSTVTGPGAAADLRKLRDLINARGSSTAEIGDALAAHAHTVAQHSVQAVELEAVANSKLQSVTSQQQALALAIDQYAAIRLPFVSYVKARWARSTPLNRVLLLVLSPVVLPAWLAKHCIERLILRR
jgi:hypothetical protein